jgi:SAM-dependent MidA family methyltransferase
MHQGDFLAGLGIFERAEALSRGKDQLTADTVKIAVERLAGNGVGKMGELFKVLVCSSPAVQLVPFVSPNKKTAD